ncbi:MAG: hypothetical protein PHO15_03635 [Eubacteriales bacterium]|nr:hypothetical protein [Eubacteriales bacterium]
MNELPKEIIRFDVARVEFGKRKMCQCNKPHYEIDYQNRLVYCGDCGAIVDPFEAITQIARHYQRIERITSDMLEQRRQIDNYKPRRVVIKKLEQYYIHGENAGLEPTCPHCGASFNLKDLLSVCWVQAQKEATENA